ncbi:hypothetical protein IJ076_01125 [Candidatus Saccharibacteria bacterium]|nr:hypothetical protein [Candidatus Saccharibacteria bacterium]
MQKIIIQHFKKHKTQKTGKEKIITLSFKIITFSFLGLSFGTFTPVFAETMKSEVNIRPSMTLDVSASSVNLNLDPATNAFASEDIDITVGTNNKAGYWISMSSATSGSDLVNINDNTKTIPTITTAGSYTSSNFPINQWGYKIDSGNYTPFVSGATIKSSNTTANGETFKLNIASKIDYLQSPGTYNMVLNIKMLPNVIQEYMQDITPEMCTEEPSVVMDKRDGQTYTIARLKDGKCWMTQNLKLGKYTDSLTLTSENSNVGTSGFTLDGKLMDGKFIDEKVNISTYYCTDNYGCYYNWYTAVAGSGNTSSAAGNMPYSICPANWILPSGDSGGDFEILVNAYGGASEIVSPILLVDPPSSTENINGASMPGFLLGGDYRTDGVGVGINLDSVYWSKSMSNKISYEPYDFFIRLDRQHQIDTGRPASGRPVRCLLKEF